MLTTGQWLRRAAPFEDCYVGVRAVSGADSNLKVLHNIKSDVLTQILTNENLIVDFPLNLETLWCNIGMDGSWCSLAAAYPARQG